MLVPKINIINTIGNIVPEEIRENIPNPNPNYSPLDVIS
jgi:hypothetical protein